MDGQMTTYEGGDLPPKSTKALKEVIDQYAAVENALTALLSEVAKLPAMTEQAAREIQYTIPDHRSTIYGPCDEEAGRACLLIGRASSIVKAMHEAAIANLQKHKIPLRQPRTKALHRIADSLKDQWPGAKFGR